MTIYGKFKKSLSQLKLSIYLILTKITSPPLLAGAGHVLTGAMRTTINAALPNLAQGSCPSVLTHTALLLNTEGSVPGAVWLAGLWCQVGLPTVSTWIKKSG